MHRGNQEMIKIRKPPMKKATKIFLMMRIQHFSQDIAMDIVIADRPRLENLVRVDQLNILALQSINFGITKLIINVKKHNPASGRE